MINCGLWLVTLATLSVAFWIQNIETKYAIYKNVPFFSIRTGMLVKPIEGYLRKLFQMCCLTFRHRASSI